MQELSLNKWRNINYRIPRHTWLYFEYFFVSGIMHLGQWNCRFCLPSENLKNLMRVFFIIHFSLFIFHYFCYYLFSEQKLSLNRFLLISTINTFVQHSFIIFGLSFAENFFVTPLFSNLHMSDSRISECTEQMPTDPSYISDVRLFISKI